MELRVFLALTAGAAVLALPLRAADQPMVTPEAATRDISDVLRAVVARHRVPGLSAVVLRGEQVVGAGAAGVRKAGAPDAITREDRFLLSSASKPMTATVAALVVDDGKLSWQSTLGEILAEPFPRMDPAWRTVTLAQLLDHRSGVPGDGAYVGTLLRVQWFSNASPAEKRRMVLAKILQRPPLARPGSSFGYSGFNYFLVAAMLEQKTGRPFEELIRDRLWEPLGIASGGFGSPGTAGIDQPWGHWGSFLTGRPIRPTGFWGRLTAPLFYASAGTVHMTMTDWGKFIALHLRGDPANPRREAALLSKDSFATLHYGVSRDPASAEAGPLPDHWPSPQRGTGSRYEGGWFLEQHRWAKGERAADTGRVIRSLGDNGFWHADAQVAPEIDFAVLVICNQGGVDQKPAALACEEAITALRREFLGSR